MNSETQQQQPPSSPGKPPLRPPDKDHPKIWMPNLPH